MDEDETRNGTGETDDDYANIYFFVGDRMETATFRPDHVTNKELKELFRSAAEAGPLDIVKLRKDDKLLNISPQLPSNTPNTPYVLQVVGAHPTSLGMIEADILRALERRVAALEREFREHQEAASSEPSLALLDLKRQMDAFRDKLETTEHLSWLGFYKKLPEPVSSEACRRLQYRRKSDSVKRRVREKFLNICDVAVSSCVREWLRSPAFDARQWEDEELLLMLQTMFVELELLEKFDIPISKLRHFLYEVYNNYNEVPFHNFRHCFCVAQMMYAIAWAVDLPSKIGHLEVFVLIVSCICHDLDHPGYNNIYQINARTELALRYNDISPLENHHCSVAFRVLEAPECNILGSLDAATFRTVREGIIRCILATDMARHNEILSQFNDTVPDFDYQNKTHINLLSMVLIKVADISNEARPMDVAEPWLDSLLQEFFKQSDAEKLEGLPVTPFMDRDKVTKPSSQCSFIGLVLLPLFESLGELLPELQDFIVQPVRFALEYYRRLNEAAKDERHHRKSVVDLGESGMGGASSSGGAAGSPGGGVNTVAKSTSSHSMRSKRSAGTIRSRSRSTDEDMENSTIPEAENPESSDPETATEVEISEKTLKFKISTESTGSASVSAGRKSYPGSRKGSREKSSLDYHNHDLAKAVRDHERERRRSRGENLSSDMSSPVSARSFDDGKIIEEFERDETTLPTVGNVGNVGNDKREDKEKNSVGEKSSKDDDDDDDADNEDCQDDDEDDEFHTGRKDSVLRNEAILSRCCCCCCDEDDEKNPITNNHKSLLSRLRNFTDRLSISFDTRDATSSGCPKLSRVNATGRILTKSESVTSGGSNAGVSSTIDKPRTDNSSSSYCKRCNLTKMRNNETRIFSVTEKTRNSETREITETRRNVVDADAAEKRATTLPKVKKSLDSKSKNWRIVFVKEKRPSVSLETLPAVGNDVNTSSVKHKRNSSNPEDKIASRRNQSKAKAAGAAASRNEKTLNFNDFKEIDVRRMSNDDKPEIIVNPGSSDILDGNNHNENDEIDKIEIRRSSASMEDISMITKQSGNIIMGGGGLEEKKNVEQQQQHTGSLDSMLHKARSRSIKKIFVASSSPCSTKKSSPGLFSRLKSGMSIDGTRSASNSGSLNADQTSSSQHPQHPQQQTGWISSLTASFRPKRQSGDLPSAALARGIRTASHEGVK